MTKEEYERFAALLLASRKVMAVCNTLVAVCLENSQVLPDRYFELAAHVEEFIRLQHIETEFNFKKEN